MISGLVKGRCPTHSRDQTGHWCLISRLDLTEPTRNMGTRKLLKEGILTKAKSGRKLRAFLCSDILVLTDASAKSLYRMVSTKKRHNPHTLWWTLHCSRSHSQNSKSLNSQVIEVCCIDQKSPTPRNLLVYRRRPCFPTLFGVPTRRRQDRPACFLSSRLSTMDVYPRESLCCKSRSW